MQVFDDFSAVGTSGVWHPRKDNVVDAAAGVLSKNSVPRI